MSVRPFYRIRDYMACQCISPLTWVVGWMHREAYSVQREETSKVLAYSQERF